MIEIAHQLLTSRTPGQLDLLYKNLIINIINKTAQLVIH